MVTTAMKRYRVRTAEQAAHVGPTGATPIAAAELFGRQAPLVLEVGFGHGDFITATAAARPEHDVIGVEYDRLRVTKTAHKAARRGLTNLRLFQDEAWHFVHHRLEPGSIAQAYVLFPDPWPRRRHRRRRLLTRAFLLDLAWCLAPGARLTIASDRHDYAFQALSNVSTLPGLFVNRYQPAGYAFDIPTTVPTVFERHRKRAGCHIAYLAFERTTATAPPRVPYRYPGKEAQ